MAIGIYFHPESMTASQYDSVISKLEAAGAGRPPGRLHHSCFGPDEHLMVYDVWDSSPSRPSARPSCRSFRRSASRWASLTSCPSTT